MPGSDKETVTVHVNIELTVESLTSIVRMAKQKTGPDSKGHYRVDTADVVSEMVSRFLIEKDFESYTKNPGNYSL